MSTADPVRVFKTGLTLEGGVEQVMRKTHDELIEQTEGRRLSGVRWRIVCGRYDVLQWLHVTGRPDVVSVNDVLEATVTAYRDQARALIREHGDQVVVVVAECWITR